MSELLQSLRRLGPDDSGFREIGIKAATEIDRLQAALGTIESLCSDEIRARFGSHHSKTEEELAGKSKVYSLLVIPRNIARSALSEIRGE